MLPYKGDEDMFGEDFLFGASLSGFQFEMGRTSPESIDRGSDWYVWAHDKLNIENGIVSGTFPESGPNYWTGFEEFQRLAAGAGMKIIRIGLEWSRILPKPTFERWADDLDDICNTEAIEHYRGIIGDIRNRGMKVIVNLNHFS
ncbi:MAG: family 1 glycosylhydrolase, partial [Kosmotogaceae bacterium]